MMSEEITSLPLFDKEILPVKAPEEIGPLTCFGIDVDTLARQRGGWPADAVVYRVEGINDEQAMLTGEVPIGPRKKDTKRPQFAPRKAKAPIYRLVIPIADWRALFGKVSTPAAADVNSKGGEQS